MARERWRLTFERRIPKRQSAATTGEGRVSRGAGGWVAAEAKETGRRQWGGWGGEAANLRGGAIDWFFREVLC